MSIVQLDEQSISTLKSAVSARMSAQRFTHTLGVEQMSIRLGEIFMPELINELRVAALLHDISKEMDIDEQLLFIDNCDRINKKQKCVPQALHSFSAVAVILKDFPQYATDNVLNAVESHTLGSEEMSLFSEIIFIADYIEEGRTYFESSAVRSVLFDKLDKAITLEEKIKALHYSVVLSIENTLKSLNMRGLAADERSIKTKKSFEALI